MLKSTKSDSRAFEMQPRDYPAGSISIFLPILK